MTTDAVHNWFVQSAKLILGPLPSKSVRLLRTIAPRTDSAVQDQAALVLFICQQYASGWNPDKLAKHIVDAGFFRPSPSYDVALTELVLPVRTMFLACQLAIPDYWDPGKTWLDFFLYECHHRRSGGLADDLLASDMTRLWEVHSTSFYIAELNKRTTFTASSLSDIVIWARDIAAQHGRRDAFDKFVGGVSASIPPSEHLHALLASFVQATAATLFVSKTGSVATDSPPALQEALRRHTRAIRVWGGCLYFWEQALIYRTKPENEILKHCLRIMPIAKRESSRASPNVQIGGPVDRIRGEEYVPRWIRDYVFSGGGRFSQNSVGPIPYFLLALEPNQSHQVPSQVGLGVPEELEDELYLPMRVVDGTSDPPHLSFWFSLRQPESLRTLMLVVATESVRLEVLRTDQDGNLTLAKCIVAALPPQILHPLKEAALKGLKAAFGGSPDRMRDALAAEKSEPIYGFLQFENAKSEELLLQTAPLPNSMSRSCKRLWKEFASTRDKLLALETRRVQQLERGDLWGAQGSSRRLKELRVELGVAEQKLRGRDEAAMTSMMGKMPIEMLAEPLDAPDRCFLHLSFERDDLIGCFLFSRQGQVKVEAVFFPEWKLGRSIDVVNDWLGAQSERSEKAALSSMLRYFGKVVGIPIRDALTAKGVRHVVVSPSWFLSLVPLHCLHLSSAQGVDWRLMDEFESIGYAPSLRLLHRSRTSGSKGATIAFAHKSKNDPLPCVELEAELVSRFLRGARRTSGPRATPREFLNAAGSAAVLHAACHGEWVPDDPVRSSLVLGTRGGADALLSAAQIQAEGNFKKVALITLSACDSGRFLQKSHTFQEYRGMDGIFLAKGARAVVSTLWSVDDVATTLIMSRMYFELGRGATIDMAFRNAINQMRHGYLANMPTDRQFAEALDDVFPDWRSQVRSAGAKLRHPMIWGAFRCSGVTWHPIPS